MTLGGPGRSTSITASSTIGRRGNNSSTTAYAAVQAFHSAVRRAVIVSVLWGRIKGIYEAGGHPGMSAEQHAPPRHMRATLRQGSLAKILLYLAIAVIMVWTLFPFYWAARRSIRNNSETMRSSSCPGSTLNRRSPAGVRCGRYRRSRPPKNSAIIGVGRGDDRHGSWAPLPAMVLLVSASSDRRTEA